MAVVTVALSLGLTYLFRRFVDRRPWSGMALPALGRRVPDVLGGFLLGAVMLVAVFLVEWAVGWVSVVGFEASSSGLAAALIYAVAGLIGFAAVGFREEIAFRGYLFQNLGERLPVWVAALLFGVVFGAVHYGNDGFGLTFVVGALIVTVFLVLTRLLTGSLWFAIGWHGAWDFMQFSVLGIAVAEDDNYGHALVHLEQRAPALWVGDGSSIEGGLVAIGVIALATVVSAVLFTRRAGSEGWSARLDEEGSPAGARDRSTG